MLYANMLRTNITIWIKQYKKTWRIFHGLVFVLIWESSSFFPQKSLLQTAYKPSHAIIFHLSVSTHVLILAWSEFLPVASRLTVSVVRSVATKSKCLDHATTNDLASCQKCNRQLTIPFPLAQVLLKSHWWVWSVSWHPLKDFKRIWPASRRECQLLWTNLLILPRSWCGHDLKGWKLNWLKQLKQ